MLGTLEEAKSMWAMARSSQEGSVQLKDPYKEPR
jgi:hypothetical protein